MSHVPRETFLILAARSRLIDTDHLARFAARLPDATADQLAEALIQRGDLTHFQARKLLRGHSSGLAIGPYRLLAPLGRGGMGTVFLARDVRQAEELGDDVLVALKVLPPRVARSEARMLARFRREIELGKRVGHPNIARTLGGGVADGVNYLAMEFVPGRTVRELVEAAGAFTVGDAARVFADIAAGLAHLHDRGLIHRDLKPSNVMVRPDGGAKILDLGLALAPGDPLPDDPSIVGGAGYILGTMDYIAPEQARDSTDVGPHSDLYSLGCALYFALTGSPPFPGGTSKDKIRWQRTADPAPLASLNPTVPVEFSLVVDRFMAKNPAERPASAAVAQAMLLPFATAATAMAAYTVEEVVGAVDTPQTHPELWTEDDSDSEEGAEGRHAGEGTTHVPWMLVVVIAFDVVLLLFLLGLLRRL